MSNSSTIFLWRMLIKLAPKRRLVFSCYFNTLLICECVCFVSQVCQVCSTELFGLFGLHGCFFPISPTYDSWCLNSLLLLHLLWQLASYVLDRPVLIFKACESGLPDSTVVQLILRPWENNARNAPELCKRFRFTKIQKTIECSLSLFKFSFRCPCVILAILSFHMKKSQA